MKIGIGGIKFSPELVQYTHHALSPADRSLADLLKCLTERRINLPFLCTSSARGGTHSTFCVAAGDVNQVEMLLAANSMPCDTEHPRSPNGASLCDQLQVIHGVGTLTLFPHRRSLALLGRVVEILGQSGMSIHSLCTSISALAINIDFVLLDQAVEVLEKIVELPQNHAPFRPEFCVRQISL